MNGMLTVIINFGVPLTLIIVAYIVGSLLEKRHFSDIRRREKQLQKFPALTTEQLPADWNPSDATLMAGSIVVSLDYFKRIIAGLRGLIGGRVKTYEPLLDRARREAMLRLVEQAQTRGFDAVINVRLETSRMANSQGDSGTAGVEMIAFGTAIKLR